VSQDIRIIGVPQDLGQSLRGVDMGPGALRYAGLLRRIQRLGHAIDDLGNIEVSVRDSLHVEGGMECLPAIVRSAETVYRMAAETIAEGALPLFLGGDHSIAIGTIGGVSEQGPVGLLWIDAHADVNTPDTSPSGNVHGMPLASAMGFGPTELVDLGRPGAKVRPEDVMIIGVRDLDPGERRLLKENRVGVYTMREIDERGIGEISREALARLEHCSRVHVSLDMDALDPLVAPGVGTPVPGGLSYREAHLLMEILHDDSRVGSVDVVEINPMLDSRNGTAAIAVELIASLLGQQII
jgi:arginase